MYEKKRPAPGGEAEVVEVEPGALILNNKTKDDGTPGVRQEAGSEQAAADSGQRGGGGQGGCDWQCAQQRLHRPAEVR